jgi:pyruvate dehydrogenase E2 component (dihydrolipoamide acetyltransferase)
MELGTFTISNLGAFGVDAFTPIINWPECAVLGVGRIRRQPVVTDNGIVAREQVTLSLTFDHRIVDGADAARFLQTLVQLVENPDSRTI